ncbi:MAG: PGPGW domain-containing protein [Gammaproteobacteria bacterium]|jgi:hypothetical protein
MIGELLAFLETYEYLFVWLGVGSLLLFLFSIAVMPWFVSLIPVDYFRTHHEIHWRTLLRPRSIVRNIIGLPVLLAGLLMLFLPGQGLLTVMIGLAIMVYPGKFRAERWLVRRQGVLRALNWMRKRRGVPPLDVDGFINE